MGWQGFDVQKIVSELDAVIDQRECAIIYAPNFQDTAVALRIGHAAIGMPPDFPGENHVLDRDGFAITPRQAIDNPIGDRDALTRLVANVLRHRDPLRAAIFETRQRLTNQTNRLPVLVEDDKRPDRQTQHITLRQH